MLLKSSKFSAGDCYGWEKLLWSAIMWSPRTLLFCCENASAEKIMVMENLFLFRLCNEYELLFYPRYHLAQSSILCWKPLFTKPMVMDVYQDYLLITYRPFDVHIYHVKLVGELSPSNTPDIQLPQESMLRSDISTSSDLLPKSPPDYIFNTAEMGPFTA